MPIFNSISSPISTLKFTSYTFKSTTKPKPTPKAFSTNSLCQTWLPFTVTTYTIPFPSITWNPISILNFSPHPKPFQLTPFVKPECFSQLQLMPFLFRFSFFPFPTCFSFCSIVSCFVSSTPYHGFSFCSTVSLTVSSSCSAVSASIFASNDSLSFWLPLFCALFFCLMVFFFPFLYLFLPFSCCGVDGCYITFTF